MSEFQVDPMHQIDKMEDMFRYALHGANSLVDGIATAIEDGNCRAVTYEAAGKDCPKMRGLKEADCISLSMANDFGDRFERELKSKDISFRKVQISDFKDGSTKSVFFFAKDDYTRVRDAEREFTEEVQQVRHLSEVDLCRKAVNRGDTVTVKKGFDQYAVLKAAEKARKARCFVASRRENDGTYSILYMTKDAGALEKGLKEAIREASPPENEKMPFIREMYDDYGKASFERTDQILDAVSHKNYEYVIYCTDEPGLKYVVGHDNFQVVRNDRVEQTLARGDDDVNLYSMLKSGGEHVCIEKGEADQMTPQELKKYLEEHTIKVQIPDEQKMLGAKSIQLSRLCDRAFDAAEKIIAEKYRDEIHLMNRKMAELNNVDLVKKVFSLENPLQTLLEVTGLNEDNREAEGVIIDDKDERAGIGLSPQEELKVWCEQMNTALEGMEPEERAAVAEAATTHMQNTFIAWEKADRYVETIDSPKDRLTELGEPEQEGKQKSGRDIRTRTDPEHEFMKS